MNHTPGPWTQDEYGSVKTPSGETLLVEGVAFAGRSTEETRANTRLIAAADDLLAALKELVDDDDTPDRNCNCHVAPPCSDCVDHSYRRELISSAKAAIKKAEGQS